MLQVLPYLILIGGFLAAGILSKRALSQLSADQKAQDMGTFSTARKLNLAAIFAFVIAVIWRPTIAWVFIALYFVALTLWGVPRLVRLDLPRVARNRLLIGQLALASAIVACAGVVLVQLRLQ